MNLSDALAIVQFQGHSTSAEWIASAMWSLITASNDLVRKEQAPLISQEEMENLKGLACYIIASPKEYADDVIHHALRWLNIMDATIAYGSAVYNSTWVMDHPENYGALSVLSAMRVAWYLGVPITDKAIERLHALGRADWADEFEEQLAQDEKRREYAEREINFDEAAAEARAPVYHPCTWGD